MLGIIVIVVVSSGRPNTEYLVEYLVEAEYPVFLPNILVAYQSPKIAIFATTLVEYICNPVIHF